MSKAPCFKKVEGKKIRRFFFFGFLSRFFAVSLHEELQNTMKICSKIRPENLKKPQKKVQPGPPRTLPRGHFALLRRSGRARQF
jgi:hypothetical protein